MKCSQAHPYSHFSARRYHVKEKKMYEAERKRNSHELAASSGKFYLQKEEEIGGRKKRVKSLSSFSYFLPSKLLESQNNRPGGLIAREPYRPPLMVLVAEFVF